MVTDRSTTAPAAIAYARRHRERGMTLASPGARHQILSLHATGVSAHTAAAALNAGGGRTTDGARWTANTVTAVLSREAADNAGPDAPGDDAVAAALVRDVAELWLAVTAGQLEVHYQPVVDMVTADVSSVEALVRWRHPVRGLVPPSRFVPLAEQYGLMAELTEYVVRAAIRQTEVWAAAGHPLRCAINLSASSLADPRESGHLLALLRDRGELVTVEVTEGVLADERAIGVLRTLAGNGVDIAIDDFGTGYSCLAALKDLPASTLKIDRSFLVDLDTDHRAAAVVGTILQLAEALGLDVIAEGIEREAVAASLVARGVSKAQGFLYARPMPPERLDAWLAARAAPARRRRAV